MITLKGRVTEVARRSDGVMTIAVRGETEVGERKGYWFLGGLENSLGLALDQEVEVMVVPQPTTLLTRFERAKEQLIAHLNERVPPVTFAQRGDQLQQELAVLMGAEDPMDPTDPEEI